MFPSDPEQSFTVADASIHAVAEHLVRLHLLDELPASLIRVRTDEEGLEVATRPLDGEHPDTWLLGHRAPPDVDAMGVVTAGRMFSIDHPGATIGRVCVASLVSRRGELACASVDADGNALFDDGLTGRIVDVLKRCMAVATDPPPCGAEVLFAQLWLSSLVVACDGDDPAPGWPEAARHHLCVELFDRHERDDLTAEQMGSLLKRFAGFISWERLRRYVDEGVITFGGTQPGDGAWFDDGAFARRLLGSVPSLGLLRREVCRRLDGEVWEQVAASLDAGGLPHTCWPDPAVDLRRSA